MITIPPYLQPGSTIAITCTAGYLAATKVKTCVSVLKKLGYKVLVGKTVGGTSKNYFSGTDEERLADIQTFLNDENVAAILCGRGGYGTSRIIDKIDFTQFVQHPKWIIGFSDITVLHSYIYSNFKIASIHSSMASAFNDGGETTEKITTLLSAITGKKANYKAPKNVFNKLGEATGKLVGGNLSLLVNGIGTSSELKTKNCILFIEDLGEQLYNIDRMLVQLKRSGKLKNLAALIVGGFTDLKDTDRKFGKTIYEIVADAVAEYNYPVCYDFPTSHGEDNVAIKHGIKHDIVVNKKGSVLKEL